MLEASILIPIICGFLWFLDRKDARHQAERENLYQRIQAPEVAVAQHAQEHLGPNEAIMPLTEQESADDELQAVLRRMERIEAGGLS